MKKFDYNLFKEYKFYNNVRWISKIYCNTRMRVKYLGLENVPNNDKGFIICMNHQSNFDAIALSGVMKKPIHFMGKQELFDTPFVSWLVRHLNAFPVKRGKHDHSAIDYAVNLIKNGYCFGIMPEGTRNKDVNVKPGKAKVGIALIARKAKCPILPCALYAPHGNNFFGKCYVKVGNPITYEQLGFTKENSNEEITNAAAKVMQEITKLWEELRCLQK